MYENGLFMIFFFSFSLAQKFPESENSLVDFPTLDSIMIKLTENR